NHLAIAADFDIEHTFEYQLIEPGIELRALGPCRVLDVRTRQRDTGLHPQLQYTAFDFVSGHDRFQSILEGMGSARKRCLAPFLLAAWILGGCGAKDGDESTMPSSDAEQEKPDPKKEKTWGGWRWKGKRQDCFFVYRNQCFDSKARACKAAGCGEENCQI